MASEHRLDELSNLFRLSIVTLLLGYIGVDKFISKKLWPTQ